MTTEPKTIDHEHTRDLVCPWCGYEHDESWEFGGGQEGEFRLDCHSCDQPIAGERRVTVVYYSQRGAK